MSLRICNLSIILIMKKSSDEEEEEVKFCCHFFVEKVMSLKFVKKSVSRSTPVKMY
jgi:hypothetical protein